MWNGNDSNSPKTDKSHKQMDTQTFSGYEAATLKQSFADWKYVLVHLNDLAEWEHQYDPLIIISVNTFLFGLMMYYSPSLLTTVAIIGLVLLLIESVVPILLNYVFKASPWDNVSESKYTRICEQISNLHQYLLKFQFRLENIRKERHSLYFCIVLFALIFCGYLGQCIDNVLLTYIAIMVITLTPGFRRHKMYNKIISKVKKTIGIKETAKPFADIDQNLSPPKSTSSYTSNNYESNKSK